jgi:hypothetical protein
MPSAAAQDVLQAILEQRAAQKRREMAGVQGLDMLPGFAAFDPRNMSRTNTVVLY